ncbi:hypothetical protein M0638_24980 [Roseomonas sp. NAR14]|uniref:PD-(D/E)XK nuclease superfamily protein n=1 Tax=Roseomonas acroporae TaxID=2937791 RepID=A0A9X1YEJ5_9PROT|nr:hypothetical protein [Roseomonas acroporae]MCK8787625.1 hypothetical protein [Roseomonas acroporae]
MADDEMPTDDQSLAIGAMAYLSQAAVFSVEGKLVPAMKALDEAARMLVKVGVWDEAAPLWVAVHAYMLRMHDHHCDRRHGEISHYHPLFKANVEILIPGATLIPVSGHPEGRCDFLVEVQGQIRPVEIKRDKFDRRAKDQLRRYIEFYEADHGYAAAPSLACTLDAEMTFIDLDVENHPLIKGGLN